MRRLAAFLFAAALAAGPARADRFESEWQALRQPVAYVSTQTSNEAYEVLLRHMLNSIAGDDPAAFLGFMPNISVVADEAPSAFVRGRTLVITRGMIEQVESPSELAFVMAHELGHVWLGKTKPHRGHGENVADEVAADAFALRILKGTPFEQRAGYRLISRLVSQGQAHGLSMEHLYPSLLPRLQQLQAALSEGDLVQAG